MKNQVSSNDTQPIKNYKILLKDSIIDGADEVRIMSYRKTVNRNVLSFPIYGTSFDKLHIDGADFNANQNVKKVSKGKIIAEIA